MTTDAALEALQERIDALKSDADRAACRGLNYVQALYIDEMYRLYIELRGLLDDIWIKSGLYQGRSLGERVQLPDTFSFRGWLDKAADHIKEPRLCP